VTPELGDVIINRSQSLFEMFDVGACFPFHVYWRESFLNQVFKHIPGSIVCGGGGHGVVDK
jgi:hypothetical protein